MTLSMLFNKNVSCVISVSSVSPAATTIDSSKYPSFAVDFGIYLVPMKYLHSLPRLIPTEKEILEGN